MEKTKINLLEATENFARDILVNQLHPDYAYHNLDHTVQVVECVETIGQHEGVTGSEIILLKIAAWLHDLGYIRTYVGHEEESINIAREFLRKQGVEKAMTDRVSELIEATRLDIEPRNSLEGIIKDADLFNIAQENAIENSEGIRKEWKVFYNRHFTDLEWDQFNYDFFREHEYYSSYGKEILEPQKDKNIKILKQRVKKGKQKPSLETEKALLELQLQQAEERAKKFKRKFKKIKVQRPDRGIETMFRTTYRTHISLSSIADNKANILLSINAIIISIIITKALDPAVMEGAKYLTYPLFAIILVCMATIVFAILATRPKINSGIFSREDILEKKTNLLFFGNFHNMDLDDYQWGIDQMMDDAKYLYGSMAKDIYFLGRVLAKKFQLLRVAYNVFMYGMVVVLVIFGITFWMGQTGLIR